jgi:hypothetical protein
VVGWIATGPVKRDDPKDFFRNSVMQWTGRLTSFPRMALRYCASIGCSSVEGSSTTVLDWIGQGENSAEKDISAVVGWIATGPVKRDDPKFRQM